METHEDILNEFYTGSRQSDENRTNARIESLVEECISEAVYSLSCAGNVGIPHSMTSVDSTFTSRADLRAYVAKIVESGEYKIWYSCGRIQEYHVGWEEQIDGDTPVQYECVSWLKPVSV
jgi:hypothetical protein